MTDNKSLKVGAAQIAPKLHDQKGNLSKIEEYLQEAQKSDIELIVFPECTLTGYSYSNLRDVKDVAEAVPGPSTEKIISICRRLGLWTVVGLVEVFEGQFYNTAVLIGPGGISAKCQKTHLPYQALDRFTSRGRGPLRVHETSLGKIGVAICYDLFFPETVRVLTLLGGELIVIPTNWAEGVEFYVDYLCQARAVENHINLVAVNRVGEEGKFKFYGRSQIVDYRGKVLAEAGEDEKLITAEIDMEESQRKHIVRIPGEWEIDVFKDRRPELYRLISSQREE